MIFWNIIIGNYFFYCYEKGVILYLFISLLQ